jgi:outer membrane protein OmpA-like peptidoglycan-associated protein
VKGKKMTRIWLSGGVALLAMSTSAFAQQATGLYVSAGVGANWVERSQGSYTGFPSDDMSFDVGPAGVAAVGYDFGMFRAEGELGLRTNDDDKEYYGGHAHDATGHDRVISAMANALVDFDVGFVTLYAGGGLGIANLERNYFGDQDDDTEIAYQGIAGAAYSLTPQLALTAEYRYFSTFDDFDFGHDSNTNFEKASYASHSALLGLRYTFAAPAAPVAAQEVMQAKSYLVFFDFDSSNLTPDAQSIVATAAADALQGGSPRIDVTGHTDRSGSDAYNQALSIRRATAVQNALVADGVPVASIVIRGAGESEPLVPTADGVREPQNRRVEIVIN